MNVTDMGDFLYRNQALSPPAGRPGAARANPRPAGLPQVQGTGAHIADSTPIDKKSPLYEQCQQFEAIFAKMMLKEMRNSVDKTGLVSGGWAEDIYTDMLDDNYSSTLAKTANFGLADQLYRQLSKIK